MKLRRRISRRVNLLLLPAFCCAISGYFGYSFLFGERGLIMWRSTQDQLSLARHDLARLRQERESLEHRISLLNGEAIDPDLLDEVAHRELLENRPGEIAVPRGKP